MVKSYGMNLGFGGAPVDQQIRKINRTLVISWTAIVIVLITAYTVEIFKGTRTPGYVLLFSAITGLPALLSIGLYLRKPDWEHLRYFIVVPYFILYCFVMFNNITPMVFAYILPMLSLLVLYHQPKLILSLGVAVVLATIASIAYQFYTGGFRLANSNDAEIQIAVLLFSFWGSYQATKLYDKIMSDNEKYIRTLALKNEQIQRITLQTVSTVAHALDARDGYTQGHSTRVSEYAALIARELGLSDEEIENIRTVALLHDIGKIGVPDAILNKPARLTDEEYALMKQHPSVGGEILKEIDTIPGVEIGARYHHERYGGGGYPAGLEGESIPYIARIIAVADAYDAMTSNRVYRKHLSDEDVIAELERCSGSQFDPHIAQVTVRMLRDGRMRNLSQAA